MFKQSGTVTIVLKPKKMEKQTKNTFLKFWKVKPKKQTSTKSQR